MPWNWPVDVNYHEAKAYAAWQSEKDDKQYRLVTEAEHHCLRERRQYSDDVDVARDPVMTHSGADMNVNINFKHGSECPVDAHGASPSGHHDTLGNTWEWTEDWFYPLQGFEIHSHYTDFSTPCFDGRHKMILGGAFISTGDEASDFARFHFRPHFLQQSGFRLVDSSTDASTLCVGDKSKDDFYESEIARGQYLLLHYGDAKETFRDARHANEPEQALNFMQRCANKLSEAFQQHGDAAPAIADGLKVPSRALDLGCAVGGATLELTKSFDEVIGVDFSHQFIDIARDVQKDAKNVLYYPTTESGKNYGQPTHVNLSPDLNLSRANFRTGDACDLNMHALGGSFDAALMANLICRLPDPAACLKSLSQANGQGVVRKGGVVMIVTPFSWLEEYTPRNKWLWDEESEFGDSFEAMCEVLKPNFELVEREPMPLIIREHRRKWQYICPDASIFKRIN